jgi:uncharacterized protein with HEPN domain
MKSHQILCTHILGAIERIEQYTKGLSEREFLDNFLIQDGVMRNIEIIAEASKKIDVDVKDRFSEVPWRKIVAMRNKIIHEYFGVDLEVIWNVVSDDLPELKIQISKIKESE